MEVALLGRFVVRREGRDVEAAAFGGRLARRLVRVLAVQRGRPVSRDALVEALWEGAPPRDPDANLNALVGRARRALQDDGLIQTVQDGYLLRATEDVVVDVEVFELAVLRARQVLADGTARAALAAAEAALSCWTGEPLPEDRDAAWARPSRDRLLRLHQEALECGAAAAVGAGAGERAVDLATRAVAAQPLREAAHLLLVRAQAAAGDQAAALAAYERLRRALADELGVDPSPDAAAVHQRLLRGELVVPAERDGPPLLGRERELAVLRALGGEDRLALVAGRSGSGKSRLLAELGGADGRLLVAGRAVRPEREAPWSLVAALLAGATAAGVDPGAVLHPRSVAALSDLLPDRPLGEAGAIADGPSQRALVRQAAARLLGATARAAVVVDDLQWADSSSLEVLDLLAHQSAVVLVLAYRPEEVVQHSPVGRFLADLRAGRGPVELELAALPPEAVAQLTGRPELTAVLLEHTDGTPLAVLEVVRELTRTGALDDDVDVVARARDAARAGKQRAVMARADREAPDRRELLRLLSLLGRPASASLLAAASGRAVTDVLDGLDALSVGELVRHDGGGFAPAHDLVGDTVRGRLSAVERAGLHQRLAAALVAEGAGADEVARHLAGAGDLASAAQAYSRSARDRLERHADQEAEQLADEGLALPGPQAARAALLETRSQVRARRGELAGATADLRAALAVVDTRPARSRLLSRLAAIQYGSDDLLAAADLAELALTEAAADPASRARALYVAALIDMNLEQPERSERRASEALALFEQTGDTAGIADVLDARAMNCFIDGDVTGGILLFERVARLFTDTGNLLRVMTPRSTRGHALVFAGRPDEALVETEAAVELARGLGYADGEGMALWHRSEALGAAGDADGALRCADEAMAVARRVGHRAWTATADLARGLALDALGDPDGAEAAFRSSLTTSEHLALFRCWAHARLGSLLVGLGRLEEAASHVASATAAGPALAQYEARLARCRLAIAREEPTTGALLEDALLRAVAGGHRTSATTLALLRGEAGTGAAPER